MGIQGISDKRQVVAAKKAPKNGAVPAGKKPEKAAAAKQQGCLITGKPDFYQPMDRDDSKWEMSDWPNKGKFNCYWRPENISFNNGIMTIKLSMSNGGSYPYNSGEYRTNEEKYSFGYYEARMKAAKGAGLVGGTFFTYSGVWGNKDHNEIDFEIFGDATKVQLNYYYAGTGTRNEHARIIDLGFDASQGFHNYGFVWKKNSIEWFIDGRSVYKATKDVPKNACRITVNFWPGTSEVSEWLGGVYNSSGSQVQYDWIKYLSIN